MIRNPHDRVRMPSPIRWVGSVGPGKRLGRAWETVRSDLGNGSVGENGAMNTSNRNVESHPRPSDPGPERRGAPDIILWMGYNSSPAPVLLESA